jgi:DNA-directed RNA polymerase subunit RPC12/RpoP
MSYNHDHENEVTYFAKTNFRSQMMKFGIKTDDRRRHCYVIGKTGMGKSVLLENLILSDIYAGHGCCYVDPHGDTAEKLVNHIPSWRSNDVVYFNPADLEFPVGFNILEAVSESGKHLIASGMMGVFAKIWEGMWSSRMEYILNNTILALLDNPGQTLLGINRMMSDAEYRKRMVGNISDPVVKQFWVTEFASWTEKYQTEATASIQNKIGQFLSAGVIRNIVSQVKSTINIREIMEANKILIINLSKGRIGEDNSKLLGGLIITKIQLAAMERVDTPEHLRKDFYLYVDEFQNFAVESFASILSEARKYRLCLTMAHQYIAQLTEPVRDAVFGNVGTMITFRVGSPDAAFMETEFMPRFLPEDIINLPKYNIYLKLLIDGVTSQPFSAITLPPIAEVTNSAETVIKISRERYASPRSEVEEKVLLWSGMKDSDTDAMYKAADAKRKAASGGGKGKPKFEYNCSRCETDITLPVELDRSRAIYCDDCIKIVREEKKSGVKPGPVRSTIASRAAAAKKALEEGKPVEPRGRRAKDSTEPKQTPRPPKPSEGELIEKPAKEAPVSLASLSNKPTKPSESKVEEASKQEKPPEPKQETPAQESNPAPVPEPSPAPEPKPEPPKPESKPEPTPIETAAPVKVAQPDPEPVKVEPTPEPKVDPSPKPKAGPKPEPRQRELQKKESAQREPRKRELTESEQADRKERLRIQALGEKLRPEPKRREPKQDGSGQSESSQREPRQREPRKDRASDKPKESPGEYACSECSKIFTPPVKLDPTRDVFCNECLEKNRAKRREEKEVGKDSEAPAKKKRKRRKKNPDSKDATVHVSDIPKIENENKPKTPQVEAPAPTPPPVNYEAPKPEPKPQTPPEPSVTSGTLKTGQSIRFD